MEIKLDKNWPVAATLEQAWAVLSDIHAVAACMPGAQIVDQVGPAQYKGTVKARVGPAAMLFNGDIELQGLDRTKRELRMLGKGADKSGSSAQMKLVAHLEPAPEGCALVGNATVLVSGKLAQFGSRLLQPVSDAMLAQFADNFRAAAAAAPTAPTSPARSGRPDFVETTIIRMVEGSQAPGQALAVDGSAPSTGAAANPGAAAPPVARPAAPVKELNALALLWQVVKAWFAGLFGKKAG
jgi:carbon monoxide dehydrogenase subunit G